MNKEILINEISKSPEETWAIAKKLIALVDRKGVIALHGDLGAGKTCFVQGISQALGIGIPI